MKDTRDKFTLEPLSISVEWAVHSTYSDQIVMDAIQKSYNFTWAISNPESLFTDIIESAAM